MRPVRPFSPILFAITVLALAAPSIAQEDPEPLHGFLGISLEKVSDAVRSALALEEGAGVMVGRVVEGAAAEEAGLVEGDVIVSIDDRPLRGPGELMATIAGHAPGDSIRLEVWRQGQAHLLEAYLGERPQNRSRGNEGTVRNVAGNPLGLTPLPLTDQLADYFIAPGGVLVAQVAKGSVAAIAGLLAGDVIVSIDDQEVRNPGELASLLARVDGPTVLLAVVRNGADIYLRVALPAAG